LGFILNHCWFQMKSSNLH